MEDYELLEKPGFYIIFDHENLDGKPASRRCGTERDAAAIRTTLDGLGFDGHATVRDAKQKEIFVKLTEIFSLNFDAYGAIFVFIFTHGGVGYTLQAYDVCYTFINLYEEAIKCAHSSLKGKPKVFIIQACNGEERDKSTSAPPSAAVLPSNLQYSPHPFLLPAIPHVLLAFSSSPGYVSYRHYFIRILCDSIVQHCHQYDMERLLLLARRELADIKFAGRQDGYKQMAILISTLTKKLRLHQSASTTS